MSLSLQSPFFHFSTNPAQATWSLSSAVRGGPSLEEVQMGIYYRPEIGPLKGYRRNALSQRHPFQASTIETIDSIHGTLRQARLASGDPGGLQITVTFALSQVNPLFLWQIAIRNNTNQPVYLDRLEMMNAGFIINPAPARGGGMRPREWMKRSAIRPHPESGELAFFSNGWQSWSYSGVYGFMDRFHRTRLGRFRAPTNVNPGTPQPLRAGLFSSDMFGILGDRTHRTGILAGFLSQKQHFGSLEALADPLVPALRMWANGDTARLDPGQVIASDWACIQFLHLDLPDAFAPYLEAVSREHALSESRTPSPVGWCSWYQFSSEDYTAGTVTAQKVRENLKAIQELHPNLPLEAVQIDDGFEAWVGDWFSFQPGFPQGVAPLADEIRQAGFTPGLWLAPFIVHPRSRLAADHPDWLLYDRRGRRSNAGYFWGAFNHALDLTHPDALEYASRAVETAVHRWGFKYLKLDFLYAGALGGRHRDPRLSRAQILRSGLRALRKAAGDDATLVGCGCPLGPAIGLVDTMRIGADTGRRWRPSFRGIQSFFHREPNLPSARNASHNAITRAPLHLRWWINDPDCLLLQPNPSRSQQPLLTLDEVHSLATLIALSGGSLMLSDHMPDLPEERLRILRALLPLIGRRPHVLDWFDRPTPQLLQIDLDGPGGIWHLLAKFNWAEERRDLSLELNEYYLDTERGYIARSFWDGAIYNFPAGSRETGGLTIKNVPAHGVVLLAARPLKTYQPLYVGGDLHISQGMEVRSWMWESAPTGYNGILELELERPGRERGEICLYLPGQPIYTKLNGQSLTWRAAGQSLYTFPLAFERHAHLIIRI